MCGFAPQQVQRAAARIDQTSRRNWDTREESERGGEGGEGGSKEGGMEKQRGERGEEGSVKHDDRYHGMI